MNKAKPALEVLLGWKCDIRRIEEYVELPENYRKYIEFVEGKIGFPITITMKGYYVVGTDIEKFFDNVNQDKLMTLIELRILDRRILKLIRQIHHKRMTRRLVLFI